MVYDFAMREALFLAPFALVAMAYIAGPSDEELSQLAHTEPPTGYSTTGPRTAPAARDEAYAAWVAGETRLPRAGDGHFYADVSVNNGPVHMLVDTGASAIALTGDDARRLGINWSPSDVAPIARGASGPVYGVAVTLDHVKLGGHEARNVQAMIVPEGLGISLLGQSFLSTVQPVRIDGEAMVLGGS